MTTSSDYFRFVTRDRSLLFYAAVTLFAFKTLFFKTWPHMSADLPTLMSFALLWLLRLPHDAIAWDFAWHFFFKEEGRVSYPKVLGVWTGIIFLVHVVLRLSQHAMLGYVQEVTGGCKSYVRY
ncbi:uncharacterized protein RHO25_002976 [Cercospora beticola]|uniref:Derlin n=1 Tax=Cercospora beticola TaxID=122368 RepID=A0ABZ0NFT2_CERBT|nr:hypothetical protein RHO25_002976 [Cercospora beticola]